MQVIQCLYKIGIITHFPADFIELCSIGTVLTSYYDHCVSIRCYFPCVPLPVLCGLADGIHNTYIVTFFLKNFNYSLKFIVIKCRLGHNTHFFFRNFGMIFRF